VSVYLLLFDASSETRRFARCSATAARLDAGDDLYQSTLGSTVLAVDRVNRATLDRKRRIAQRRHAAEAFGDVRSTLKTATPLTRFCRLSAPCIATRPLLFNSLAMSSSRRLSLM
jgi:hypothetical protein